MTSTTSGRRLKMDGTQFLTTDPASGQLVMQVQQGNQLPQQQQQVTVAFLTDLVSHGLCCRRFKLAL